MGNTSSSQQDIEGSYPHNQDTCAVTKGSESYSKQGSVDYEEEIKVETVSVEAENSLQPPNLASTPQTISLQKKELPSAPSFSGSPFVGSPLFESEDLLRAIETKLPSPTGTFSIPSTNDQHIEVPDSPKAKPVVFGKKKTGGSKVVPELVKKDNKTSVQPDSFPSSLSGSEKTLSSAEKIKVGEGQVIPELPVSENGLSTLITWTSSAKEVYVIGTFNGWKHKIQLTKSDNEFSTVLQFTPGIHHLKFIVDDEWKCSNDLLTATDHEGNLVNYIEVDDQTMPLYDSIHPLADLSSSPPGEYTSVIPEFLFPSSVPNPFPNYRRPSNDSSKQPPLLPPLLEKVLLNAPPLVSEANSAEEDWLVPVPNHVVLNHLYACSIRDGVMAVAGTSRYRQKYVTTIYYKPVVI